MDDFYLPEQINQHNSRYVNGLLNIYVTSTTDDTPYNIPVRIYYRQEGEITRYSCDALIEPPITGTIQNNLDIVITLVNDDGTPKSFLDLRRMPTQIVCGKGVIRTSGGTVNYMRVGLRTALIPETDGNSTSLKTGNCLAVVPDGREWEVIQDAGAYPAITAGVRVYVSFTWEV